MDIICATASPDRWPDVEAVFGPNGAYSNCWCTWWMLSGRAFDAATSQERQSLLEGLVTAGEEPGIVAYRDGKPVGWVAVGPRQRYARMMSPRAIVNGPLDFEDPGWVVNCFFIQRGHRGEGIASRLLAAAVEFAFAGGASHVVGHPIDTDIDRRGPAALYVGTLRMFLDAGFTEVARRRRRPVVRIDRP